MSVLNLASGAELLRLGPAASPGAVVRALRRDGAVIVENLLTASELASIEAQLNPWFERAKTGEGLFLGRNTKRFSAIFAKAPATAALAIHPLVLDAIEEVLSGGAQKRCDAIQLNLTQAIGIAPGERAQVLHRDDAMFPFTHDFELMINAMWTLDAFTIENGATRIAPESHFWPRDRAPQPDELVAAAAPKGSVILWLGSVLHGGGENKSRQERRGLTFSYSLGWLNQAEKLLLSIPLELAQTLAPRLQALIGYQVHRPNLGWVEERDPLEWLMGQVGAIASAQDHFTPELEQRLAHFYSQGGS